MLCLVLALGLAGACGKKIGPLSPDLTLPGPVRDFRLEQSGDSLVASWLLPRENRLGQPLTQLAGFRLYRGAVPGAKAASGCAPDFVLVADIDLAYPRVGEVRGEAVAYRDQNLSPGNCYSYKVAGYGPRGHQGTWSPVLSQSWAVLPRAPGLLEAQAGDREVLLSWPATLTLQDGKPIPDLAGYYVFRREAEGPLRRLTPEPQATTRFQDVAVHNDVEYTYTIRAARRLGKDLLVSLDSPARTVTPRDFTAPPPVLNLVAVPTPKGVELRWEASPAPDLAGYRVYRRRGGEAQAVPLTPELLKKPYFVDTQAAKSQTYYYAVTAVDNSQRANESLPSEEVQLVFQ